VIAHRLSTVKDADQVIYMEKGRVLAHGTFDDVKNSIPSFATQAKLSGL
jgi:ATP-binding cassette subfamily C protein